MNFAVDMYLQNPKLQNKRSHQVGILITSGKLHVTEFSAVGKAGRSVTFKPDITVLHSQIQAHARKSKIFAQASQMEAPLTTLTMYTSAEVKVVRHALEDICSSWDLNPSRKKYGANWVQVDQCVVYVNSYSFHSFKAIKTILSVTGETTRTAPAIAAILSVLRDLPEDTVMADSVAPTTSETDVGSPVRGGIAYPDLPRWLTKHQEALPQVCRDALLDRSLLPRPLCLGEISPECFRPTWSHAM